MDFEEHRAVLWRIFSNVAKQHLVVNLDGKRTDKRSLYNFHESLIDALRPVLGEGVRSVIITAPMKTTFSGDFMDHVQKHHSYLLRSKRHNRAAFAELAGSGKAHNVAELVKTEEFRKSITEATSGEASHIVDALDTRLFGISSNSIVLYTLREIEDMIYSPEDANNLKMSHLVLTDKYLTDIKEKGRLHRLLQISKNKKVKTRIVDAETSAGKRISQFGGIVFFTISTSQQ